MSDGPDFEEIGTDHDPVGSVTTRQVQQLNRIDVPDEFMEHLGLEHKDRVMVVCGEEKIVIKEATAEGVL